MVFNRQLYKQKPTAYGPPSAVQASIFKNAEKIGIDKNSLISLIPLWEKAGTVIHDYSKLNTDGSFTPNLSYWKDNSIYFHNASGYCAVSIPSGLTNLSILFGTATATATTGSYLSCGISYGNWGIWGAAEGIRFVRKGASARGILIPVADFRSFNNYNIAITHKSTPAQKFYVDGEQVFTDTTTLSYNTSWFFGGTSSSYAGINGYIDQFMLFDTVLIAHQIAYLSDNPYFLLHRVPPVFYSVPGGAITIKTITDTGSCLDEIAQISNIFVLSDTGTCLDGFSGLIAGISVVDAGSGVDTVKPIASLTVQDTGSAIDLIQQISAACSVADTGTGTDSIGQLLASLVVSDAGAGADVITVLKELLKTVTDSGTGTDSISRILASLSVSDTGSSTDTISQIMAGVSVSDAGSGADFINLLKDILKTISDTGSGSDYVSIQPVSVSVQDAGTALDIIGHIAVALSVSDAGTIAEIISTIKTHMVTVTDIGTGYDSEPTIAVSVTVSDAAAALDVIGQVINALAVSDTGSGLDRITKTDFNILPSGKVMVTFTIKTPGASFAMRTPKATFNIE